MAASRYERIGGHLDDFNRFVQNLTAGGGVLDPKVWGGMGMGQPKVWVVWGMEAGAAGREQGGCRANCLK